MGDLSKYLSKTEYMCPCCGTFPPDLYDKDEENGLAIIYDTFFCDFDDIREKFGKSIKINSGYRCIKHNQDVGGEPNSIHTFGLALDMDAKTPEEVEWLAECVEKTHDELRMGKYLTSGTFVHVDAGYYIWPRASERWKSGIRWTG